ncbi:MAG: NADH-quinone oxidoreductase subunit J family protein [Gemmatimonadaceae bacterium]
MSEFFYRVHFYLFGLIAIASALTFVTRKSPVAALLWLVNTMFSLAALYVMLDAHFVGVIQVLVYAGAIMVVFLFVLMLLNLGHPDELSDIRGKWGRIGAGFVGLAIVAQLLALSRASVPQSLVRPAGAASAELRDLNAIGVVAKPLFNENLLAFELTSILLLVAIVGAVVLGKRRASA